MNQKAVSADVSHKVRITGYKPLENLPDASLSFTIVACVVGGIALPGLLRHAKKLAKLRGKNPSLTCSQFSRSSVAQKQQHSPANPASYGIGYPILWLETIQIFPTQTTLGLWMYDLVHRQDFIVNEWLKLPYSTGRNNCSVTRVFHACKSAILHANYARNTRVKHACKKIHAKIQEKIHTN